MASASVMVGDRRGVDCCTSISCESNDLVLKVTKVGKKK